MYERVDIYERHVVMFARRQGLNTFQTPQRKRRLTMPKLKTHRSGAKRYKVTANGKILRRKAGKGHLLQHKDGSRKRKLSTMTEIAASQYKLVSKELPYKKYSK